MARHYESWEDDKRLKIITINIYPHQVKFIEKIIEVGYATNRSLFIRRILDQYMYDYYKMMKAFELMTPEQIKIMGE